MASEAYYELYAPKSGRQIRLCSEGEEMPRIVGRERLRPDEDDRDVGLELAKGEFGAASEHTRTD